MITRRWWGVWGVWALLVALAALAPDPEPEARPVCTVDRIEGAWAVVERAEADSLTFYHAPSAGIVEGERVSCQEATP